MRTDYILYVIALICFIVAGYSAAYPFTDTMANTLIVIVLAIIGAIFIWGGYSLKPQARVVTRAEPSIPPTKPAMEEQPIMKAPEPEPTPAPEPEPEPMPSPEITEEAKMEEPPPAEAPPETPAETTEEMKKPVRKRREKKKV